MQMKFSFVAFAVFLMFSMTASIMLVPSVSAHSPAWKVPTYAYLNVSPNPVGQGQSVLMTFWLDKVPPTAGGSGGLRWVNFTLTITLPDNTTTKLGPFISTDTASQDTTYIPSEAGTYKVVFNFPGQIATLTGPPGATGVPPAVGSTTPGSLASIGDYYEPSSTTAQFVCQQQPLTTPPQPPLPTSYWSRPVNTNNPSWTAILSNWLGTGGGSIVSNVQPNGTMPLSGHILWTRPLDFGGIVGQPSNDNQGTAWFHPGPSYEVRFPSPIIINGRLYYPLPLGNSQTGGGYECVDLKTGQQIWWENNTYVYMTNTPVTPSVLSTPTFVEPTFGQLYQYVSPNQWGTESYLWAIFTNQTTGFQEWRAIDPNNGMWEFNLLNVPTGGSAVLGNGTPKVLSTSYGLTAGYTAYGPSGEIEKYFIGNNGKWLAMWNNTAAPGELLAPQTVLNATGVAVSGGTNAWQWKPLYKNIDASTAWSFNTTLSSPLPASYTAPSTSPIIAGGGVVANVIEFVAPGNFMLVAGNGSIPSFSTTSLFQGITIYKISLQPQSLGNVLWSNYIGPTPGNLTLSFVRCDPVAGTYIMGYKETEQFIGYSLATGKQIWGPIPPVGSQNAFQYYGSSFVEGPFGFANWGNLYFGGYGGLIYSINDTTGKTNWIYNGTTMGLNGPYDKYPIFVTLLSDGMVVGMQSTHGNGAYGAGGSPYDSIVVLNATTGKVIWSLLDWDGGSPACFAADGSLVYYNQNDGRIYCVGEGQTATTVKITPGINENNKVLISGTVMDESPGVVGVANTAIGDQPVKGNGPGTAGTGETPAISDKYMDPWMNYLYMQQAMPTNATGVPVTLSYIDPNNNTYTIGTATSDISGHYSISFTPNIPGSYTVIATFAGSHSYFASSAETSMLWNMAPSAAAAPTATPTSVADAYFVPAIAGLFVLIIVVAVVLVLLMLRKKS